MRINIVGSLFGTDGYTSHTKGIAHALYKLNPDIKLDVPLPQNWLQHVTDAELQMIKTPNRIPDVTIGIVTPPFARIVLGDNTKKYVQYVVWEGDSVPVYWISYLMDDRIDQIWCPSMHTRSAILFSAEIAGVNRHTVISSLDLHRRVKLYLRFLGPKLLRWLFRIGIDGAV